MVKRTFSFGVQFCEFSHMHEPASFYRASQTLHCDRSEAKRFRLTLSRCSLCWRSVGNQTRGVTKAAGVDPRNQHARGTEEPCHPSRSPCAPRTGTPAPSAGPGRQRSRLHSCCFAVSRRSRAQDPAAATSDLRDGPPPLRSASETRWCWTWRLFARFYYRETLHRLGVPVRSRDCT